MFIQTRTGATSSAALVTASLIGACITVFRPLLESA
jgi:hypothetical protein